MEKELNSKLLKEDIEKYHLNFLSNESLDTNSKYSYLKSQLFNFYEKLYSNQISDKHFLNSPTWNNLHHSLSSLLNELILTANPAMQLSLLEKIHKWYTSKVFKPAENSISVSGPDLKMKKFSLPAVESPVSNQPNRNFSIYVPRRQKPRSRDKVANESEARYYKMLETEKIGFQTTKHRSGSFLAKPKSPISIISYLDVDKVDENFKKVSKTPDLEDFKDESFVTPSLDFRGNSKFRTIAGIDKSKMYFRMPNKEISEINTLKGKLARRRVKVDIKMLENASRFENYLEEMEEEHKRLPKGGEMLLKVKKKEKKKKKSVILLKKKKNIEDEF